ncbi:MAG: hypothetical protein ACYDER_08160 [Ktedonobacteraceae bacterium]
MAAFAMYTLSDDDQVALRENPRLSGALLRPCQPLAEKQVCEGEIYAPLSVDDERWLQGFHGQIG